MGSMRSPAGGIRGAEAKGLPEAGTIMDCRSVVVAPPMEWTSSAVANPAKRQSSTVKSPHPSNPARRRVGALLHPEGAMAESALPAALMRGAGLVPGEGSS